MQLGFLAVGRDEQSGAHESEKTEPATLHGAEAVAASKKYPGLNSAALFIAK